MRNTLRELGNGLDITRAYRGTPGLGNEGDNLLQSITAETAPGLADRPGLSFDYTYDANKNLNAEDTGGVMDDYGIDLTHDAKDRMTGWDRDTNNTSLDSQDWTLSFEADWDDTTLTDGGVGTTQTRTHDAAHQLLTLDPDATGSLPAFSQTHDPKGNLTADGSGRAFTHDFDNMLSSVTVSPGASLGTPGTHSYTYDALGRRVSKTTSGGGGTTTVFTYTGNQVIAEYTAGTAASNPDRKYVYCVTCYIDEPIALIDATGSSEATYYYHRNRQFSIIGLTDSTGVVIERYAYDAYGDPTLLAADGVTVRTASSYGNAYLHTARRYDAESALYYYRARMYDAQLGQFIERDPLGYPDGMNTYAAYHVMWGGVDPYGLEVKIEENEDSGVLVRNSPAGTRVKSAEFIYEVFLKPDQEDSNCCIARLTSDLLVIETIYATVDDILRVVYKLNPANVPANDPARAQLQQHINTALIFERQNWQAGLNKSWETRMKELGQSLGAIPQGDCIRVLEDAHKAVDKTLTDLATDWQRLFDADRTKFNQQRPNPADHIPANPNWGTNEVDNKVWPIGYFHYG